MVLVRCDKVLIVMMVVGVFRINNLCVVFVHSLHSY